MDIRGLAGGSAGPQGLDALAATAAPAPVPNETEAPRPLGPPVRFDVAAEAHSARYARDLDTQQIVFEVVEPTSGDVIDQLPTKAALRARAYAAEVAAHGWYQTGVDRTA